MVPELIPSETLVALVQEYVHATLDTVQLVVGGGIPADPGRELAWAAHLDYLKRLQREAHTVLAGHHVEVE